MLCIYRIIVYVSMFVLYELILDIGIIEILIIYSGFFLVVVNFLRRVLIIGIILDFLYIRSVSICILKIFLGRNLVNNE